MSVDEELARVLPVVRALAAARDVREHRHAPRLRLRARAVEAGAAIVNDVSGFRDPAMVDVARGCDCRARGHAHAGRAASTMQDDRRRTTTWWTMCATTCATGQPRWRLRASRTTASASTPALASARRRRRHIELVRNFQEFARLGYPVMAALSRKSYIGWAYRIDEPSRTRPGVRLPRRSWPASWGRAWCARTTLPRRPRRLKDLRPYALHGPGLQRAARSRARRGARGQDRAC